MRRIKKKYRIFYFPFLLLGLLLAAITKPILFLINGLLPDESELIQVDIQKVDGDYRKIYKKGDKTFEGDYLTEIEVK